MHNGRLPTRSAAASFLLLPADEEVGEPGLKMSCFDPALATSPLWALIGGGKSDKTSTCSSTSCSATAPLTCSACQAAHYCSRCCICFAPMLVEIKATFPSHFPHVHLLVGHLFSPHLPALRLFQKRRKSQNPISYPQGSPKGRLVPAQIQLHLVCSPIVKDKRPTPCGDQKHCARRSHLQRATTDCRCVLRDKIKGASRKKGPRQYTAPVCLGCHRPASLLGPRYSSDQILPYRQSMCADVQNVSGPCAGLSARRNRSIGPSVRFVFD